MKKYLLAILLVATCGAWTMMSADEIYPSIRATKWHGVIKHTPANFTGLKVSFSAVTYYQQGDTIINDTTYQAIWRNEGEYYCGLRKSANGQQVYYRPSQSLGDRTEYLLYDFDVQAGDSLNAFDWSCPECCDYVGCDPTLTPVWKVLDVVTIDGRKHVRVQGGQSMHTIDWIEGIGTCHIFYEYPESDGIGGAYTTYALCAADAEGNTLYSFNTDEIGVHNNCPDYEPLAIEHVTAKQKTSKRIEDGQLLIQCNGKTYNAQGAEVK